MRMTNEELRQAIEDANARVRTTAPDSPVHDDVVKHLRVLLLEQQRRASMLPQWQAGEIIRLRERVFELGADPHGGDVILLAEPRCGELRRTAERCVTAWTVVRSSVRDPNGLMDEHIEALRKALGPNFNSQTPSVR